METPLSPARWKTQSSVKKLQIKQGLCFYNTVLVSLKGASSGKAWIDFCVTILLVEHLIGTVFLAL